VYGVLCCDIPKGVGIEVSAGEWGWLKRIVAARHSLQGNPQPHSPQPTRDRTLETVHQPSQTGLPATKHQEQVLAGDQQGDKAASGAGGQAAVPASPHQEQVLAEPAAGKAASGQQAADLVAQASDMAAAGNEEGCMQKVAEAKDLLGID
jgi:hypothetical protein